MITWIEVLGAMVVAALVAYAVIAMVASVNMDRIVALAVDALIEKARRSRRKRRHTNAGAGGPARSRRPVLRIRADAGAGSGRPCAARAERRVRREAREVAPVQCRRAFHGRAARVHPGRSDPDGAVRHRPGQGPLRGRRRLHVRPAGLFPHGRERERRWRHRQAALQRYLVEAVSVCGKAMCFDAGAIRQRTNRGDPRGSPRHCGDSLAFTHRIRRTRTDGYRERGVRPRPRRGHRYQPRRPIRPPIIRRCGRNPGFVLRSSSNSSPFTFTVTFCVPLNVITTLRSRV